MIIIVFNYLKAQKDGHECKRKIISLFYILKEIQLAQHSAIKVVATPLYIDINNIKKQQQ